MSTLSSRIKRRLWAIPLLLSPYFLGFTPGDSDSSWTEFRFGLGGGSYADVSRDCNGRVLRVTDVPFSEATASVDHYTSIFHFGIKAGVVSGVPSRELFGLEQDWTPFQDVASGAPMDPVFYATPTVGLNSRYIGLDVGYVLPAQKRRLETPGLPAGSLRIGRTDDLYFRIGLADDLPLVTGRTGVVNLGFGFNLGRPRQSMWLGLGGVPSDGLLVGAQLEHPLSDDVVLRLGGTLGGSESFEYGFSAGARIIF